MSTSSPTCNSPAGLVEPSDKRIVMSGVGQSICGGGGPGGYGFGGVGPGYGGRLGGGGLGRLVSII